MRLKKQREIYFNNLKTTFPDSTVKEFMHEYSCDENSARTSLAEMYMCYWHDLHVITTKKGIKMKKVRCYNKHRK